MAARPIVVVTGITGFIGSHVADQFLAAGYDVRGTTRTIEKGQVIKKALDERHGPGRVELFVVPEISADGAYDEVVKGAQAVAHVASIMSFSKDPSKVIPPTVAAVTTILASCLKESSIKSFVYTSSTAAAIRPKVNQKRTIDKNSWNDEAVKDAWKPESEWQKGQEFIVYGASKTEAERALWRFRDEQKPHFTINAVLPATNFGPVLSREGISSSGNFLKMIYEGNFAPIAGFTPHFWVDVRDTARLHVAAVQYPEVDGRRMFAWEGPYNWNMVLKCMREVRPEHTCPDDIPDPGMDVSEYDNSEDEELLMRIKGSGWTLLKESVEASLQSYGY